MKKNDLAEVKKMDIKSLQEKAKKGREELVHLQLDKGMKKLTNLKAVNVKRRDLARVLTVLKQKQVLEQLEDKKNAKK